MAARKKTTKTTQTDRVGTVVSGAIAPRYTIIVSLNKADIKRLPTEVSEGNYNIARLVRAMCVNGATNDQLFQAVQAVFPDSKCAKKKSLVTWYRGDAARSGKIAKEFGPVKLVEVGTEVKEAKPATARKKATKAKAKTTPRKKATPRKK
jgi:hypothetical protein